MLNEFSRTELLLGKEAMEKLKSSFVAVFGVGGVGSYAAEALARSGIGAIDLYDDDRICLTNINRQLPATHKTVGQKKVEAMKERILEINPKCSVGIHECFYTAQNADEFDLSPYDYIIDAIDTVSSKLALIERAKARDISIISCMGAGNKLNPAQFEVADIYETSVCPLAKVLRHELRKRKVDSLKVVYSKETALTPHEEENLSCKYHCICPPGTKRKCSARRQVPGSVSFVPPVAGFILASEVVKDLAGWTISRK
ncbi:MAG: tRNA threonylcarbamoyladenosine dehydratase [Peptococcaceae bacterium]|nr:tRNA threonylcarbamoyladenosine dehydratase [Peptococcaceae bacterium]